MAAYLRCLRAQRGVNRDECRVLSKEYLECRMERNLMARDSLRNLGFAGLAGVEGEDAAAAAAAAVAGDGDGAAETAAAGEGGK